MLLNPLLSSRILITGAESFKITGKATGGPRRLQSFLERQSCPCRCPCVPFQFNISNSGLEFVAKSDGANLKLLEPFIPSISNADVPIALVVQIQRQLSSS